MSEEIKARDDFRVDGNPMGDATTFDDEGSDNKATAGWIPFDASKPYTCYTCGTENPAGVEICSVCGAQLSLGYIDLRVAPPAPVQYD